MITVEKLEKGTYFDDAFKISFRYDPTTVAKVKELAERRYLPEDRAWEIPAHELPALIEKVGLNNIKSEETVVQALNTKEIEDKREATQERLKGIKPVRDFDFKTAPLPHQIEAFNYGMEKNSLLIGDEQGLGKTKESIDICVARKKELIKTLIVCGVNSVKYNWEKEIRIHSNESCVMVDGKTMDVRVQQLNDWYRGSAYFGVINIESLRNEKIQDALYLGIKDGYIGAIIVDEIHKAKNGGSQQGKALRFLKAPVKIGLSGTPMNKAEDTTAESYDEATKYFATQKVNYIVGAPDLTTEEATKLATWVKGIRKNSVRRPVAVLPKTAGDSRGVINFEVVNSSATNKIEVGEKQYTEAEYCSRIAGLLAGLDLRVSATYKPLTEVTAIPLVDSDEEVDTAIDAGKLTLYNDGERVVIARGVNSLTTVTEVETADLQKIKINAIQDQIEGDIYSTINKSYIGNYSNSYDNKCLLITAIKGYLRGLEATEGGKGWLKADSSTMEINVAKQKQYLESIGVDTSEMDEQAIKEANTGSHVFLKGTISILDAIEDVDIFINKD